MIHWAEKRAMSANATVLAYLGRAQPEELPHTFPILQTWVRCGVMSRISKEARLPPPDSVHGVLPLSDVKASRGHYRRVAASSSHELRQFVEKGISNLRSQLNRDTALAKAELQKQLSEVRMTPTKDGEDWHYVAEGNSDLLGTGPNAPVLGLPHSDGCGGLQCTEGAGIAVPI